MNYFLQFQKIPQSDTSLEDLVMSFIQIRSVTEADTLLDLDQDQNVRMWNCGLWHADIGSEQPVSDQHVACKKTSEPPVT